MAVLTITEHGAKGGGADDTAAIQSLIDGANYRDVIRVPAGGGKFMINALPKGAGQFASGGIFLKSNLTLLIEAGASLQALPNAATHYTIVTVKACSNTSIIGPGSIVGDRDTHVDPGPTAGQWGFGVSIWGGSTSISVQNLGISKCWGDGLTVIGASNVLVDRVTTDSCRRQNMSVIQVDGMRITNSTFNKAQYSGLDLEADDNSQTINNVLVQYCNFQGTVEGPAHIGVGSATGTYKGIKIADCQFDLRMQPIFVHDNAGSGGTPWWAFLLNRVFYEGLKLPTYRFVGYPQSWSSAT